MFFIMDAFSRCHPAVSFVFFLGAIGGCVLVQHPAYLLVSLAAALIYACLLTGLRAVRLAVGLVPLTLVVALVNPLFSSGGEHVLFFVFSRPYTLEALVYGFITALMLLSTILWFSCYSSVMTSEKFMGLFSPLMPSIFWLRIWSD